MGFSYRNILIDIENNSSHRLHRKLIQAVRRIYLEDGRYTQDFDEWNQQGYDSREIIFQPVSESPWLVMCEGYQSVFGVLNRFEELACRVSEELGVAVIANLFWEESVSRLSIYRRGQHVDTYQNRDGPDSSAQKGNAAKWYALWPGYVSHVSLEKIWAKDYVTSEQTRHFDMLDMLRVPHVYSQCRDWDTWDEATTLRFMIVR